MQLMTFNSLLMFDIVFIFFLFLVCVTCLVYYLPPRELSPAHPPLAEDDEHCHDHCHHHHLHHLHHQYHHMGLGCCDGPPAPLVRECAAAARRISGGGTPACSLSDLRELGVPEPGAPKQACTGDASDSSCANVGVLEFDAERPEGGLCPLQASPPILDHRQDYRQSPMVREDGVLLLDCALEGILPLCPRAPSLPECADDRQRSPSASEALLGTSGPHFLPDYRDEPYHNCSYQQQQQQQQNFCPSCTYACYQQHRHSVSPTVRQCYPPSPVVVNYHRTVSEEHDAPFVSIEIERYEGTGGGDSSSRGRRGSDNTGAGNIEVPPPAAPLALPACCYVRAKTSDIKECSGPIHDV
ncbi:AGAP013276-PA-like protein [Anopheles sinensis]|uniref:AGAP013276-PA-like protein n=1 Tax=Anopheles sinensis TaxID=74873 RepID=A0A084VVH2_ANOSI|nr:AGAP013276-PA-like protein [Anopheles sinensis]